MPEVTTLFEMRDLDGNPVLERTPETDKLAEDLIRHRHLEKHPTSTPPRVAWVRHHQPDIWLLFATGTTEET